MKQDTTKKIIYIEFKDKYYFPSIKVKKELFRMEPYIGFSKDKNKWYGYYFVVGYVSSSKKYVKPGNCYFTSSNGKESSEAWSYETDYDSAYVQCYDVDFQYAFTKEQTTKMSRILSGNKISAVNYENVVNTKYLYKYKDKEIKSLHQLAAFCDEVIKYF